MVKGLAVGGKLNAVGLFEAIQFDFLADVGGELLQSNPDGLALLSSLATGLELFAGAIDDLKGILFAVN